MFGFGLIWFDLAGFSRFLVKAGEDGGGFRAGRGGERREEVGRGTGGALRRRRRRRHLLRRGVAATFLRRGRRSHDGCGRAFFPGTVGAALDAGDVAVEAVQEVEAGDEVGVDGTFEGHFAQEHGVAGGDGVGQGVGELAVGEAGEFGGVGGEFTGVFEDFLGGEPVKETAVIPFGEVLRADGDAVEMFGEDGLDFGEMIQPFNEVHAGFAVVETLVELVAERAGEAGDFAGAFHNLSDGYMLIFNLLIMAEWLDIGGPCLDTD